MEIKDIVQEYAQTQTPTVAESAPVENTTTERNAEDNSSKLW